MKLLQLRGVEMVMLYRNVVGAFQGLARCVEKDRALEYRSRSLVGSAEVSTKTTGEADKLRQRYLIADAAVTSHSSFVDGL